MNTNKTAYEKPSGNERQIDPKQSLHIIEVAKRIQEKIILLEKGRGQIEIAGQEKATTSGNYDKALALALIRLKNGVMLDIEGEKIENPPASTAERIAKGICFQQKIDMEMAENKYKAIISKMQSVQAEVNALQSINRYLQHEVE